MSLDNNGANSYLFANGTEIHKFTTKDSEIVPSNLCLRNVSKDFSASNIKKKKKKLDLMVTFMILVLIMIQLMLIK